MQTSYEGTITIDEDKRQYMYDENIYEIHTIDNNVVTVTEYKSHMDPKIIFQVDLSEYNHVDVCLKTNSDRLPDLVCFIHGHPTDIHTKIYNMESGEERDIHFSRANAFVLNTYICADNILVAISYYNTYRVIYNIKTGKVTELFSTMTSIHVNHIDKKIYMMLEKEYTKIKILSIDMITGSVDDVHIFNTVEHIQDMIDDTDIIHLVDGILYCDDDAYGTTKCVDVVTGRYFTGDHFPDFHGYLHFNKKKTKMYLLEGRHVFQYAVLPNSLFKTTSEHIAYQDMTIVTRNDE